MNTCRAHGCGKGIPAKQDFCAACLKKLPIDIRHTLLFGSSEERAVALADAGRKLSNSLPPSPAVERFRAAREHAAAAMKILERKPQ